MPAADYTDEQKSTTISVTPEACPKCGLQVPAELDACPNDGTRMRKPSTAAPEDELKDKYEFLGLVGKGGMSVIYKARHKLMQKTVAIKLLQDRISDDKSTFKRFQQESQAASRLDHPNIIQVSDFGVLQHGTPYLVMDYIEGQSLSDVIDASPDHKLEPTRALSFFKQICAGLAHAHEHGVLHRDLKPSNVIVYAEDRLKIVDFGIAKLAPADQSAPEANKLTTTGEVFGSPLYMSPEQSMGRTVDARSDVYSMGCLMYEALSGTAPHIGTNAIETIFKHINEPAQPLAPYIAHEKAKDISNIVMRALEKDPDARYQTFNELLADIERLEAGHAVPARGRNRPSGQVLAASGTALILLVAAGVGLVSYQKEPQSRISTPPPSAPAAKQVELRRFPLDEAHRLLMQNQDAFDAEVVNLVPRLPEIRAIYARLNPRLTSAGFLRLVDTHTDPILRALCVDGTKVDNSLLEHIGKFPKLRKISLGNTLVTADAFKHFAQLKHLEEVGICNQRLTDADIEKLPPLPNLSLIKLDDNKLLTDKAVNTLMDRKKFPKLLRIAVRNCPLITNQSCLYINEKAREDFQYIAVLGTKVSPTFNLKKGWFDWQDFDDQTEEMNPERHDYAEDDRLGLSAKQPHRAENIRKFFQLHPEKLRGANKERFGDSVKPTDHAVER